MAFEPFMQLLRGRRANGVSQVQNLQQMAYLRRIQKELDQAYALEIPLNKLPVVVFDIETTGFSPEKGDAILSIGAVKMTGTTIHEETFYSLVQYDQEIPETIVGLTGITNEQVRDAEPLVDVFVKFLNFVNDCTLIAHHANHERNFMQHASNKYFRTSFKHRIVDTSFIIKIVEPNLQLMTLEDLCMYNEIAVENRHHALSDAQMTAKLWGLYVERAKWMNVETLNDVYSLFARK